MLSRNFEKINAMPSLLGFGCMRLPKLCPGKEDIDYDKAQAMIDYAYEHGVNYFDTAYLYHEGKSETFTGHALKKYPRESFYLATKFPGWAAKEAADVDRIFEEQLEKCQVDYFDFYLCHALDKKSFIKYEDLGIYDILKKRKECGQIRHLGFSFHDNVEALEYIIDRYSWDFVQLQINYLDWERQEAGQMYEICRERGIPVIVMEPVRGGALATLSEDALNTLKAADAAVSAASWAIRYVASLPGVMTVLSGMSTMEQVIDNVHTIENFKLLEADEYQVIEKAKDMFLKNTTIPCTACRYCMDCPAGVDIPKMFAVYNDFKIGKWAPGFLEQYKAIGNASAEACIACGVCMEHCPQSIAIPDQMEEMRECVKNLSL